MNSVFGDPIRASAIIGHPQLTHYESQKMSADAPYFPTEGGEEEDSSGGVGKVFSRPCYCVMVARLGDWAGVRSAKLHKLIRG